VQAADRFEAPDTIAFAYNRLGFALLVSREFGEALAAFEKARAQGDFVVTSIILTGMAWSHLRLGNTETALKAIDEAADLARRLPTKLAAGHAVPLCRADILLSTCGLAAREEIESALQTATKALAEMGAKSFEPDVLMRRAQLARLSGDEDRYRRELSEAHRLLTEMGATERAELVEREVDWFSSSRS
jgi:tetratricopeptide (TPR) repeat protein